MLPATGEPRTWLIMILREPRACSIAKIAPLGSRRIESPAPLAICARPRSSSRGVMAISGSESNLPPQADVLTIGPLRAICPARRLETQRPPEKQRPSKREAKRYAAMDARGGFAAGGAKNEAVYDHMLAHAISDASAVFEPG